MNTIPIKATVSMVVEIRCMISKDMSNSAIRQLIENEIMLDMQKTTLKLFPNTIIVENCPGYPLVGENS